MGQHPDSHLATNTQSAVSERRHDAKQYIDAIMMKVQVCLDLEL